MLAQGGFVATYKYAVLLALIDLCIEAGHPPTSVTTAQLARRVVELYWPQVRAFPAKQGVLRQSSGSQAESANLIAAYHAEAPDRVSPPQVGPHAPPGFQRLLDDVEWVLIKMPLPRVQRVGSGEEPFLYHLGWDEDVPKTPFRRYKRGDGKAFDNRILFVPGAAESLVALASVLRPLIQQQWMAKVRSLNQLDESKLEEFMFGVERVALGKLQGPLRSLQGGRCFYCDASLAGGPSQVDHFLPWSRYPDNGLDNLVLAHDRRNRQKLHFLADLDFGRRWEERAAATPVNPKQDSFAVPRIAPNAVTTP